MNLKLILLDQSEIELAQASFTGDFIVLCEDQSEFNAIWNKMTYDNLSVVTIKDGDTVLQTLQRLTLDSTQAVMNPDGTITGHFYFSGGTVTEDEYAAAGRILLGEEI